MGAEIKTFHARYVLTYRLLMISSNARALLEFEEANPGSDQNKVSKIRRLGFTPDGYAARLEQLVADVDVMAEYPELVHRFWTQRREAMLRGREGDRERR